MNHKQVKVVPTIKKKPKPIYKVVKKENVKYSFTTTNEYDKENGAL